MANKQAPYKNAQQVRFVRDWFREEYGDDWFEPGRIVTAEQVWDAYYWWCAASERRPYRLGRAQFEKTLRAAGVLDLWGRWQQVAAD
jgi:hypothetical protein